MKNSLKKMHYFLSPLLFFSFSLLVYPQNEAPIPNATPTVKGPNFVFIYTDDHRYDAMSVVQAEQGEKARVPWIETPNMDRLAREGIRFRNAFVINSLCAPSRATILTGTYGYKNGIVNNHTEFPVDNVTYPSLLRKAGYTTGYVGKWHMGKQSGQRPGFDFSASFVGQGNYQAEKCQYEVNGKPTPVTGWVDDVTTDFALQFIRENQKKPFAITVGFKSPHGPPTPPERFANYYGAQKSRTVPSLGIPPIFFQTPNTEYPLTPPGMTSGFENYHRCVHAADENLGKILNELDTLGLTENTMVIYTSDNGLFNGEHKLGDKRAAYEESMRVPMLLRYPKLEAKGKTNDSMVLNLDIAETILDYAGVPIPAEMQGRSWRPLLEGKEVDWRKSYFYAYFIENEYPKMPTTTAVRNETAKLVKYVGHEEWTELYDIQKDPYETKNLFNNPEHAELRKQMEALFEKESKSIEFQIPSFVDDPTAKGKPGAGKKEKAHEKTEGEGE